MTDEDRGKITEIAANLAESEKDAIRKLARDIIPHWIWPLSQEDVDALVDVQRMIEQVLRSGVDASTSEANSDG